MECIEVVESLSQQEKNCLLHVLQRDERLRDDQEKKISKLRHEVQMIRSKGVLRGGDIQDKLCRRCRSEFGFIFNRAVICPMCHFKVCKLCQEVMFNGSWLCSLCYKQRQLKWLTGEWAIAETNPMRKWASGSNIVKASLELFSGTTIDIDEPRPTNQGSTNNNQSRKSSHNGVHDQSKSRSVEFPKEGDQLKLAQLFDVLRTKKPEEPPETQVKRVSTRRYDESDSDSSSSSEVEGVIERSASAAPSQTESEIDAKRLESPPQIDSPRSVGSPRMDGAQRMNERARREVVHKSKNVHLQSKPPTDQIDGPLRDSRQGKVSPSATPQHIRVMDRNSSIDSDQSEVSSTLSASLHHEDRISPAEGLQNASISSTPPARRQRDQNEILDDYSKEGQVAPSPVTRQRRGKDKAAPAGSGNNQLSQSLPAKQHRSPERISSESSQNEPESPSVPPRRNRSKDRNSAAGAQVVQTAPNKPARRRRSPDSVSSESPQTVQDSPSAAPRRNRSKEKLSAVDTQVDPTAPSAPPRRRSREKASTEDSEHSNTSAVQPVRRHGQYEMPLVDPNEVVRPKVRQKHYEKRGEKKRQSRDMNQIQVEPMHASVHEQLESDNMPEMDRNRKALSHVDLQTHVAQTKDNLSRQQETLRSKSSSDIGEMDNNQQNHQGKVKATNQNEHYLRKSANDLLESEPKKECDNKRKANGNRTDSPKGAISGSENKTNDFKMTCSSVPSGENQNMQAQMEDGDIPVIRTGSPYSFSMDSLPSSNPSPTLHHHSISSVPESDEDSLTRSGHGPSEGGSYSGTELAHREGSGDDYVVEEISKVRFRRMSKTLPAGPLQPVSSSSPQKSDNDDDDVFDDAKSAGQTKMVSRDSPQMFLEGSVGHDDSGLLSGGSRGTTPEHRRTDSGYSQSSLPSTMSTVTDRSEDEDIDMVVAKLNKRRRRNLLSVFTDSRESLASFYSDAGDIAYSNVPVTGEIMFGINYNYKTGMLEVGVKQGRDIAAVDTKRKRSDPYIKTYLLPDKTRSGKRKTKVKKFTLNPSFEETLRYSISKSELENRTLWLTVWHNDRFGRNVFLGEVTINFDYYKFDDPTPKWYPLQERLESQPSSMMVYKGDISLSIRYVPADQATPIAPSKGKQKKDSYKGQLQVKVEEARNLTAVRSNGFSDPFCKGYLLPEKQRGNKQKTAVIKKNCNPVWHHLFVFEDVSLDELRNRCLELTIWDYEKLSSNDFLGGVRLNLGTGQSQGKPVDWMDARGEEMSIWQAMLDRPNFWIDGALILRPNMEKRKF